MTQPKGQSRITIVGAGIIGLTTACTLLKEFSTHADLELSIVSERFSPETTGDVSAGYWEPYGFESYDDRVLKWAKFTYDIFLSEFFSNKADRAGIIKLPAYTLLGYQGDRHGKTFERPAHSELVRHFRILDPNEMKMFGHLNPTDGHVCSTVAVEVKLYLKELRQFLGEDRRVTFVQKRIERLDELSGHADVIINCSGLGARHLANDPTVRPARGQVSGSSLELRSRIVRMFRSFAFRLRGSNPFTISIRMRAKVTSFRNAIRSFSVEHSN